MRYDKPKPKFVLKTLNSDFLTLFNTYLVLENGWKLSEDVVSVAELISLINSRNI